MTKYRVVLAGSGLGGMLRYATGNWVLGRVDWRDPAGTIPIHITGSFFIGLLMSLLTEGWEVHRGIAALYVMGSAGFGYLAMWLGVV